MPGPQQRVWTWEEFRAALVDDEGHARWAGPVDREGYGYTNHEGVRWRAHALAYHLGRGNVPVGMLVRNTCGVRLCCDPDHLELVSRKRHLTEVAPPIAGIAWRGGRGKKEVREDGTGYTAALPHTPGAGGDL